MRFIKSIGVVCLALTTLLAAASIRAQEIAGSISGTVLDDKGGTVAGATVTITNTDTGVVVRTIKTKADGQYTAPLLPIGHYTVTVEADGFKKAEQKDIRINVKDQIAANFKLEVGAMTQTISVNASALQVETQTATAAGLVSGAEVRELPMNTRNYEQLVTLMPGVSSNSADQIYVGTTRTDGSTNTISFSINGQRNSANNWMVDGVDNVDRGSDLTLLTYPSVDAISEFKVVRGQYDADMGRAAGGQVTVVTKSGGSNFHGDAYEFFRNDVLNANNFFNNLAVPTVVRPPLRYNDFGYTLGGPIYIPGHYNTRKDKTFFFFSEEFRRVITYGTVNATIPTAAMVQGNFPNPVCTSFDGSGNCTGTGTSISTINPIAQEYIKDIFSKFPSPNNTGSSPFALISALRNVYNARQELVRVDHIVGPRLQLSVRYLHDSIPTIEPGGLFTNAALPGVSTTSTNSPGYSWTARAVSTFSPTFLNEAGFNFSYGAILSTPTGLISSVNSPDIHVTEPTTPFPGRVPNLTFTSGSSITGFGPYLDYNRDYSVFDNMTKIHGKHTLKWGGSYDYYQKNENPNGGNPATFGFSNNGAPAPPPGVTVGSMNFEQAWANFLLGNVSSFVEPQFDLTADIREQQFSLYVQDQYRLRSNLTVTVGLRYSRFGQPIDAAKFLTNFDPSLFNPAHAPTIDSNGNICRVGPCAGGGVPNPSYDPLNGIIIPGQNSPFGALVSNQNNKDFAPRFGFAWDPWGNGKTVLRGGFGMYYDSGLVGTYEQNILTNPPFSPSFSLTNTTFAGVASATVATPTAPPALRATPVQSHTPYSQQWSLDLQREITPSLILDVGYYGNNGVHLLGVVDLNQVPVGAGVAAGLLPAGTTIFTTATDPKLNQLRPFKGYNAINAVENEFNSNYNSMQVSLRKRMSANTQFNIYYTYSHAMTNNQTDRSTAPQDVNNIKAEYGPTQFDRRHILTADYIYEIPWWKNQENALQRVVGGWEIAGIITLEGGTPLTPTTSSVDPGGLGFLGASAAGGRPNLNGSANIAAPHQRFQYFNTSVFSFVPQGTIQAGTAGRGSIIGPGIQRFDLSLLKNINLGGEGRFAQFRAEAFNVFNHTNFNGVSTSLSATNFGQVTSAHDARIMQLAMKFYF